MRTPVDVLAQRQYFGPTVDRSPETTRKCLLVSKSVPFVSKFEALPFRACCTGGDWNGEETMTMVVRAECSV